MVSQVALIRIVRMNGPRSLPALNAVTDRAAAYVVSTGGVAYRTPIEYELLSEKNPVPA